MLINNILSWGTLLIDSCGVRMGGRANAYEESQRSWTQHPTYTDLTSPLNKNRVAYLKTDWDGDDALVKAQEMTRERLFWPVQDSSFMPLIRRNKQ